MAEQSSASIPENPATIPEATPAIQTATGEAMGTLNKEVTTGQATEARADLKEEVTTTPQAPTENLDSNDKKEVERMGLLKLMELQEQKLASMGSLTTLASGEKEIKVQSKPKSEVIALMTKYISLFEEINEFREGPVAHESGSNPVLLITFAIQITPNEIRDAKKEKIKDFKNETPWLKRVFRALPAHITQVETTKEITFEVFNSKDQFYLGVKKNHLYGFNILEGCSYHDATKTSTSAPVQTQEIPEPEQPVAENPAQPETKPTEPIQSNPATNIGTPPEELNKTV